MSCTIIISNCSENFMDLAQFNFEKFRFLSNLKIFGPYKWYSFNTVNLLYVKVLILAFFETTGCFEFKSWSDQKMVIN